MKAYPGSQHAADKSDLSNPDVDMRERNGEFQVTCVCGVRGPYAKSYEEAVALWDALPRQEDYEPLFDAFDKLNDWCAAYPESVFPPYSADELATINALLKEHGYSLDCISAGVAQHMVGVVSEIVREAMKVKNPGHMRMTDEELLAEMRAALQVRGIEAYIRIEHPLPHVVITLPTKDRAIELAVYDAELDLIEAGIDVVFDVDIEEVSDDNG